MKLIYAYIGKAKDFKIENWVKIKGIAETNSTTPVKQDTRNIFTKV